MTYLENKNIDDTIHQKLRKKDVFETDMKKIYNIIVVQTNMKLLEKEATDATFQAVKAGQYHIVYLMISKKLCL